MELNHYQRESRKTALYPNVGSNVIYPTLGLVGEAGEVADKVKKILRDKNGVFDKDSKDAIKFELGDVLWYISQLSSELGYDCLLYTSPSPRDLSTSRMPSSA